ncbi:MAG: hypothetical protein P4L42_15430 [Desulfocapsaceae bacterium]|nr:hypothetical protein [Desulfocapsaceae bacterium]
MAYTSGTAANYKDLLAVLATFASANGWTILEQSATRLYLCGEGLAGLDRIYCGADTFEDPAAGYYNWCLFGSISWRARREPEKQPLSCGKDRSFAYLWNAPIPYWMVATPRRIIMVAKISTVYQFVHLGLGDPPATDTQYPYPMLIGGCGSIRNQSYAVSNNGNSAFWANLGYGVRALLPGGTWGGYNGGAQSASNPSLNVVSANSANKDTILSGINGDYLLDQIFVTDSVRPSTYFAIDGLYRVSGHKNASENVFAIDGINYMVFQDVYRVGYGDYCALRLN